MSLVLSTIPEQPADWPEWLEQELVGQRLAELIAELQTIHGATAEAPLSLSQICGDQLADVAERGLQVLSPQQMQQLLKSPAALLELQEHVLIEGGAYWLTKSQQQQADWQQHDAWEAVAAQVSQAGRGGNAGTSRRSTLMVLAGLAAALVLGLTVWLSQPG
ncbi:MAG: hypothetical protein KDA58_15850, partial [Planctomycetaceae bacterium]|nr:hypothetical protein [Planctomycetaceae bacterium]